MIVRRRRLHHSAGAIALALLLLLCAREGDAADPELQRIERIDFRGNESIQSGTLRGAMRLKQPVWWNPFRNTTYLGLDYLTLDLYRVVDLYRDRGFLLASIRDARVEVAEDGGSVSLEILVSEGPLYHIGGVEFEGIRNLPFSEILGKIKLQNGDILSRARVNQAKSAIEALYAEGGFLNALVRSDLVLDGDAARVVFRVQEGPLYRYRGTVIDTVTQKLERTHPRVISREVALEPGDALRASRILKTQERIFDTGIFRSVRVLPAFDSTGAALADLRITVRERRSGWYGFGAGYSSDDRIHLVAEWGNRNVSRMARTLEAAFDLGLSLDPHFGRHRLPVQEAEASLRYTEPWFLRTRSRNQISLSHTYEQQITFDQDVTILEDAIRRDLGRFSSVGLALDNKWVRTGDSTFTRSRFVTRNISSYIQEDRRDNILDAKRGSFTQARAEYTGGFLGGDARFSRFSGTGSWYYPVKGGLVNALRLRAGAIIPIGRGVGEEGDRPQVFRIPFGERFRLGGGTTVRGYAENSLGQTADEGQPIGGTAVFLGNVELRFPIIWLLSGAVFLDAGNVWADPEEIKLSRFVDGLRSGESNPLDVAYGGGAGLRVLTPVGPFRIDYGLKLGRNGGGRKPGELYLSLGQAF